MRKFYTHDVAYQQLPRTAARACTLRGFMLPDPRPPLRATVGTHRAAEGSGCHETLPWAHGHLVNNLLEPALAALPLGSRLVFATLGVGHGGMASLYPHTTRKRPFSKGKSHYIVVSSSLLCGPGGRETLDKSWSHSECQTIATANLIAFRNWQPIRVAHTSLAVGMVDRG